MRAHTDREYEHELQDLQDRLLLMGSRVEEMVARALRALADGDASLARETMELDRAVDADELDIDERSLLLLARRQPMGSDLRFVTFALKLVTDLERVGDLAGNICGKVVEAAAPLPFPIPPDLHQLGERVQGMVRLAIDAFVNRDLRKAEAVLAQDAAVDDLYHDLFRSLLATMSAGHADIDRCVRIQHIAKSLERIGDHATNVAEQVIFLVKGQDVRHRGRLVAER